MTKGQMECKFFKGGLVNGSKRVSASLCDHDHFNNNTNYRSKSVSLLFADSMDDQLKWRTGKRTTTVAGWLRRQQMSDVINDRGNYLVNNFVVGGYHSLYSADT